jgi:hypothetical protein
VSSIVTFPTPLFFFLRVASSHVSSSVLISELQLLIGVVVKTSASSLFIFS